jgi:HTH-type transcriptional regulator / antitoxin HipB
MRNKINNIQDLSQLIRHTRQYQGLTQADLAGMSGLGRRFISELENGKESAQVSKVILVLNILGIGLEAVSEWNIGS